MHILFYECFSGISGDMNLAAMLDLGVDQNLLRNELEKLNLSDEFKLNISSSSKNSIYGTRVDVVLKHHHHHHHDENHAHTHHHHRNLADITSIISESTLSQAVKDSSLKIFNRIAEAEAHIHNCSINEIHFHEVGATDAIVDIVGAAICRHALDIDQVICSSIELGGGFVKCAHGKMPVPAPATVEILHGIPTKRGAVQFETTTPTGAAILAAFVDRYTDTPQMTIEKTAYGIGHRDMDIPNVLRVHIGEISDKPNTVEARLLECTVDDMTAEALGYAMEKLLEAGASDVNFIPATMKKSRPATIVSVLCSPKNEAAIQQLIFRETTTLGIKSIALTKTMLERSTTQCETKYGNISIKEAGLDGKTIRSKPEFEECAAIARRENIPLSKVYEEIKAQNS